MADRTTITISAHNIITITIIWVLGLAVLGIGAMAYGQLTGSKGS